MNTLGLFPCVRGTRRILLLLLRITFLALRGELVSSVLCLLGREGEKGDEWWGKRWNLSLCFVCMHVLSLHTPYGFYDDMCVG